LLVVRIRTDVDEAPVRVQGEEIDVDQIEVMFLIRLLEPREETLDEAATVSPVRSAQLIVLDDAMKRLASISQRKSDVVELRFFGGLTVEETAAALGVSRLTVIRDWNFARAWLLAEMSGKNP
jgi:RNA polymerase sigma factor (sigma-70 family)